MVVVAHLPRYAHAAVALHHAGLLHRFVTAPMASAPMRFPRHPRAGGLVDAFNRTRVVPDLAGVPLRRMWVAQLVALGAQRTAMALRRGTALPLRSGIWDRAGSLHLGAPAVVHTVSGASLHTAALAHRRGALVVCDARAAHPRAMQRRVHALVAGQRAGYRPPDERILPRMLAELEAADVVLCNSDYTRRSFLEEGFDPARVIAVPLGCDPVRFAPADSPPPRFTVLFAGREALGKGLLDVAEGCRALPAGSRLIVAGDVDPVTAEVLRRLPVDVELAGGVPSADMPSLYRRASVLVLPSLSEGFGMVVLEAMASGLPVVVSANVGAADLVTDGHEGHVVPAGDAPALAERLRSLAHDPDAVVRMGAAARATALDNTWERYGERLVQAYRDVVLPLAGG